MQTPVPDVPVISVLLPTFHSSNYILESVWSLLDQTEACFELLLLHEPDGDADTPLLVKLFEDQRIKPICSKTHLGLAESLNRGIALAKGAYLARADADDLYHPQRFEKQLAYLESHPECAVCGTWQHHFGPDTDWVHKTPVMHEDICARLIFNCEMCHSTVMLRKAAFDENGLRYDSAYAAEDYELWTRAVHQFGFHNLPEILGEYRWDGDNITAGKLEKLSKESAQLVARNLFLTLGISVPEAHIPFLNGWRNEFALITSFGDYRRALLRENQLLLDILSANKEQMVYDHEALFQTLINRLALALGIYRYGSMRVRRAIAYKNRFLYPGQIAVGYLLAQLKKIVKRICKRKMGR